MAANFPELSSFGTLVRFARALEETAAELAAAASARAATPELASRLSAAATTHRKRGQQLELLARERLNEVVLQAVEGMVREDYLPPVALGPDPATDPATLAAVEDRAEAFYLAAAAKAIHVLASLDRTFRKLAAESAGLARSLR